LLLLLTAGGAVTAALWLARGDDRGSEAAYVCPMHPEVTAARPGECPICRMALERAAPAAASDGGFALSGEAARRLEASVGTAERVETPRDLVAPAWVEGDVVTALLYDDEIAALSPTEEGSFATASVPGGVAVRRAAEVPVRWDRSTSEVRFRIVKGGLPERGAGHLRLSPVARGTLVVPADAILSSADGTYVLAVSNDRRAFAPRSVAVGRVSSGRAAVVAGLDEKDLIVTRDAFFFDAERRSRFERARAVGGPP
jgi:hypothetical protein